MHGYRLSSPGYVKPVVWRIEMADEDASPGQLEGVEEVVRRIRIKAAGATPQKKWLPQRIAASADRHAVEALELSFSVPPGAYTLSMDIPEMVDSNFCIVQLDGAEIGSFAIPYKGNIDQFARLTPLEETKRPGDMEALAEIYRQNNLDAHYAQRVQSLQMYRFDIPFVVLDERAHILALRNAPAHLNQQMMTFTGGGFTVRAAALLEGMDCYAGDPVFPARPLVDLWGWMSMVSFEHPGERVTPPAQLLCRSIEESFQWGANNLEFLPVNADGVALDILQGMEPSALPNYRESSDPVWTAEQVAAVLRSAHAHGMVAAFFLYCLHGAAFIGNAMDAKERITLLKAIARRYGQVRERDEVPNTFDGIITEAWFPVDARQYIRALWEHQPGAFLLVSINDGSQYDVVNAGYAPAVHHYNAHWPAFDAQHTGYDHAYPILPYPAEFYRKEQGWVYTYMQGCGQTEHPRKAFPRVAPDLPFGITNRTVSEDWILAQAQSFALGKLLSPQSNLGMALCWEADEETMCPPKARRYVYAASQDPLRLAAAGRLSDTGSGGELALKRATRRVNRDDMTRIRPRHPYPASTLFLQNRFMQLLLLPDRNYTVLLSDLSATARFYANGVCVTPAMPCVVTRFRDNRFLRKTQTVLEAAGVLSRVMETSEVGSGFTQINERAIHTMFAETPLLHVDIHREIATGHAEDVETFLGFQPYTMASGIAAEQPLAPGEAFVLSDAMGILPDVALHIAASTGAEIRFVPGKGVSVMQRLTGRHTVRVDVLLRVDAYRDFPAESLSTLYERLQPVRQVEKETPVENTTEQDMTMAVRVTNPCHGPYFVREGGWWHQRGAIPSQQYPDSDYVKLYVGRGGVSALSPYGYIQDVLRAGYGCQYMLSFRDIRRDGAAVELVTYVHSENPMIYAPRIDFAGSIESVRLCGEPWQYFIGSTLLLPTTPRAQYRLHVTLGKARLPSIARTYARVESAEFEGDTLRLRACHQPWVAPEVSFGACEYAADVIKRGHTIKAMTGCTMLHEDARMATVRLDKPDVHIRFAPVFEEEEA